MGIYAKVVDILKGVIVLRSLVLLLIPLISAIRAVAPPNIEPETMHGCYGFYHVYANPLQHEIQIKSVSGHPLNAYAHELFAFPQVSHKLWSQFGDPYLIVHLKNNDLFYGIECVL